MLGEYLQVGQDCLLPNPYLLTIHYHLSILDTVVKPLELK
jgi:hypothetical protein